MDNNNYDLNYTPNYNPNPQEPLYPQTNTSKTKSIVAMVLSACSLILGCFPFISFAGIGTAIAGIVIGSQERRKNIPQARGFLIAAKACGIGGIIFSAFMSLIYIVLFVEGL